MTAPSFVHLHNHSAYSLSEGAIKVDKLTALAATDGMPAVALTDTSNMFGALEFSQSATGKGVQPILGCQIGLSRTDLPRLPPDPVVVLAQTEAGYANLQRLTSCTYLETETGLRPQVELRAAGRAFRGPLSPHRRHLRPHQPVACRGPEGGGGAPPRPLRRSLSGPHGRSNCIAMAWPSNARSSRAC